MNFQADLDRISAEYERRAHEIPAGFYSLSRAGNLMLQQQMARACRALFERARLFPLNERRILDVGCGTGAWLLEFMGWDASPQLLSGIDLSQHRIEMASRRLPNVDLRAGSASELPWEDEYFDVVTQFSVFTSILDAGLKRAIAKEMLRVLKPGGAIVWLDFRYKKPTNSQVSAIRAAEIRTLFSGCRADLESAVLVPQLARIVAPRSWIAGELLELLPPLRCYYAGLIQKQ